MLPIRLKCNQTINDDRWVGEKIVAGNEILINGETTVKWLMTEHPGCVTEIEMTEEDWNDWANKEALECKRRIEELKNKGVEFSSPLERVIPEKRRKN